MEDDNKLCVRLQDGNPCVASSLSHPPGEPVPHQIASHITHEEWTAFLTAVDTKVPRRGLEAWIPIISFALGVVFTLLANCNSETTTTTTTTSGTTTTSSSVTTCETVAFQILSYVCLLGGMVSGVVLKHLADKNTHKAFDDIANEHRADMSARGE